MIEFGILMTIIIGAVVIAIAYNRQHRQQGEE